MVADAGSNDYTTFGMCSDSFGEKHQSYQTPGHQVRHVSEIDISDQC
jgi:hypothetical protein